MTTIEKLDMIKFKLQFMVLMLNVGRDEQANKSLEAAFALLDEVKATASGEATQGSSTAEGSTQERVA